MESLFSVHSKLFRIVKYYFKGLNPITSKVAETLCIILFYWIIVNELKVKKKKRKRLSTKREVVSHHFYKYESPSLHSHISSLVNSEHLQCTEFDIFGYWFSCIRSDGVSSKDSDGPNWFLSLLFTFFNKNCYYHVMQCCKFNTLKCPSLVSTLPCEYFSACLNFNVIK